MRVKKIFRTIQGEGYHAGTAAVFVRLVGCNMWSGYEKDRRRDAERTGADCPLWCDTDFTKEGSTRVTDPADLVARVRAAAGSSDLRHVVFTGGEPLLQLEHEFIVALQQAHHYVAVETNGTVELGGRMPPDWITCSPKLPDEQTVIEYANELKLVVPDYTPDQYSGIAQRVVHDRSGRRLLWVQPEDGYRFEDACAEVQRLVLRDPRWRVSVQGHKVVGAE